MDACVAHNNRGGIRFHHVGVVSENLDESMTLYESLGYSRSAIYDDPVQKARIVLMQRAREPIIELITPKTSDSPAAKWVRRIKAAPIIHVTKSMIYEPWRRFCDRSASFPC